MPKKAQWNEIGCPECREPCAHDASVCPHCKTKFTPQQVAARKGELRSNIKGCAGLGLGALLILALISMCSGEEKQASSSGDPKKDAIAVYQQVMTIVGPCDQASAAMADSLQGGDVVTAYRKADLAASTCLGTSGEIRKIGVPESLKEADQVTLKEALERCEDTYISKWSAAKTIGEVLDGEGKASKIAEIQQSAEAVEAGQMLCVAGLMQVATSNGAESKDMGLDERKPTDAKP